MDVQQLDALAASPDFLAGLLAGALRLEISKRHGATGLARTSTGLPRTIRFGQILVTVDARHLIRPNQDGTVSLVPIDVERPHELPPRISYGKPASHPNARSALRAIVSPAAP